MSLFSFPPMALPPSRHNVPTDHVVYSEKRSVIFLTNESCGHFPTSSVSMFTSCEIHLGRRQRFLKPALCMTSRIKSLLVVLDWRHFHRGLQEASFGVIALFAAPEWRAWFTEMRLSDAVVTVWDLPSRPSLGNIYSLRCSLFLRRGRCASSHPVGHRHTNIQHEGWSGSSVCNGRKHKPWTQTWISTATLRLSQAAVTWRIYEGIKDGRLSRSPRRFSNTTAGWQSSECLWSAGTLRTTRTPQVVCFLSPESKLNTEKQHSVFLLHMSGTNSQQTAGLLLLTSHRNVYFPCSRISSLSTQIRMCPDNVSSWYNVAVLWV